VQGFIAFADSLLDGIVLVALSAVLGGVVWVFAVLAPPRRPAEDPVLRRALAVVGLGALLLAAGQAAMVAGKALALGDYLGIEGVVRLTSTLQFRAAAARCALALAIVFLARWLRRAPDPGAGWGVLILLATLLAASGAWQVHAAGRLDDRARLMALTVVHQAAAAVWVGGLFQLAALWHLRRAERQAEVVWPAVVRRFSRVAIGSVAVLALAAVPLTLAYVGSVSGLLGTGYGSLVVTKALLMAAALALGGTSFMTARRSGAERVRTRVPALVEAETILLVALLFTAAALSSQPPAVDTPGERATPAELVEVFRPKWPTLGTPSLARKRQETADPFAVVGSERTATQYSWSNFSHNVAGLCLLPMSLLALADVGRRRAVARHWPLGFVALAVFISLRSFASEAVWPFGSRPPWSIDAEALQHQIGALLALTLGLVEWRARTAPRRVAPYVLPVLAAAGGVLLLTHAHVAFEAKSSYLVQVTHVAMGALAVVLACARWLELRSAPAMGRVAGASASVAMLLIALVLIFYREANVQVP
jgi:putative copper resistance protein D